MVSRKNLIGTYHALLSKLYNMCYNLTTLLPTLRHASDTQTVTHCSDFQTCLPVAQVFNGKATWKQLAQNWSLSYVGNMIGTLTVIALMSGGGVFPHQATGVLKTAMPKVGLTFQQVRQQEFRSMRPVWS